MSREIKFRAWDKKEKQMIIPSFIKNDEKEDEYYVLMQYTGLKDKNDKEIYEGDIVKSHEGYLMTVIWQDNGFKLMFKFKRTYQGESYTETRKDISLNGSNDKRWGCEVIGNIYKNPELLKED